MALTVKTPNPAYEGTIAGVRFQKGIALFEDEKLAREISKDFGFEIEGGKEEVKPEPKPKKKAKKVAE